MEESASTGEIMKIWGSSVFTAKGMALRALLLVVLFGVCEMLGWREYTCVLCGTSPTGRTIQELMLLRAALYLLAYFGCVLGAPVLLIGAGLLALGEWKRTGN